MKKIKYAIIALCAAGLTACSDTFMDTNPTDQIGETTVASSLENLYTSLNGVHRAMVKQYLGSQSCGGEPSWDINRDVLGEDLVHPLPEIHGFWRQQGGWIIATQSLP